MDIYVVTANQMDIHCPIIIYIGLTPEGAKHYVDEACKNDSKGNEYRSIPYSYEVETVSDAEYGFNYHLPQMESKVLLHAYNQHGEGYSVFAVKVKH